MPIFAFLFIALLFFSFLVEEEGGPVSSLAGLRLDNMQGNPAALGLCLLIIIFFVIVLIFLLASAIGKKFARIVGSILQMIFALICVILGAVQGKKDGVKTYV